jgi:hypothetical protein
MLQALRRGLLFTAALLMAFAALVNATVSVPHLRADMAEINVRPALLAAVSLGLHFGTFAMFAFTCLVLVAAIQSARAVVTARLLLLIIAATYIGFGIVAFAWSGSHHTLGYVLIGFLVLGAVTIRESR